MYVAVHIGGRLSLYYPAGGVGIIDRTVLTSIPVYTALYHRNHCYTNYTATHISLKLLLLAQNGRESFSRRIVYFLTFE
jgi:hypothetical protein